MIKFVFIILPILLVGCIFSPDYEIDDKSDHAQGYRSIQLIGNHLEAIFGAKDTDFNVEKFIAKDGKVYYNIVLFVVSLNGLYIEAGESLIVLVDGTRICFSGDGSADYTEVWGDVGVVGETAIYDVTPEQLKKIADAKEVLIKINGSDLSIERKFLPENFAILKRFIADYVDR